MPGTLSVRALISLSVALSLIFPITSFGQAFSVRASAGVVYLPLPDWSSFFGTLSNSWYVKNNPNLYYAASVHYSFDSTHSVYLGGEILQSKVSMSDPSMVVDWQFQGIPVTLGYEFRAFRFSDHFTPYVGAGVSYVISHLRAHDNVFNHVLMRYGNGYGVHLALGIESSLTQNLGTISQIRYRYSDGMAFSEPKDAIKVEFTGFDFSTGIAWSF